VGEVERSALIHDPFEHRLGDDPHQPAVPSAPLNGPTILEVIQPP
jgi:hypothetical protein